MLKLWTIFIMGIGAIWVRQCNKYRAYGAGAWPRLNPDIL